MNSRRRKLSALFESGLILTLGLPILFPGKLVGLYWHPSLLLILVLLGPLGFPINAIRHFTYSWLAIRTSQETSVFTRSVDNTSTYTPLTSLVILFLCSIAIGLYISSDRTQSNIVAGYIVWGIALHSTLVRLPKDVESVKLITQFLLVCSLGLVILTPFFMIWRTDSRIFDTRLTEPLQRFQLAIGETIHPNVMAGGLVMMIPIATSVLMYRSRKRINWLWALLAIMTAWMVIVVLLTQSRGGLLALGATIIIVLPLLHPRTGCISLIAITIIGSIVFLVNPQQVQFIQNRIINTQDLTERIQIWRTALTAVDDFSFTGIGIGTFTTVVPFLYPPTFPIERYPHAHNLLLQVAVDLGLPGLTIYCALLINVIAMLFVILRKAPHQTYIYSLAIGTAGSLTAMIIHGMVDAVMWGTRLSFLPWALFALITQMFLQVEQLTDNVISRTKGEKARNN